MLRRILLVAAIVLAALFVLQPNRAVSYQVSELIVFSSDRDGDFEVYVMNPDGSSIRQLTFNTVDDYYPRWSPNGTQIAFVSMRDGDSEIFVMDPLGDNVRQLTFNNIEDYEPNWSPDGQWITFVSDINGYGEICRMDSYGGNMQQLTYGGGANYSPDWAYLGDGGVVMPPASSGSLGPSGRLGGGSMTSSGNTNFGSISLSAGFTPDPTRVDMVAGGSVDISRQGLGSDCYGYATSISDYRVYWSGRSELLRFYFASGGDTTMVVRTPNGDWLCNDDYHNADPEIRISYPASGQYDIWIGTYSAGTTINGTLYISELIEGASSDTRQTSRDPDTGSNYGSVSLSAGFLPDPYTIGVRSGGGASASDWGVGSSCVGYVATTPDFQLYWSGSSSMLHIYVIGDGDTTLLVRNPNGYWYCNDDYYQLDPSVFIEYPTQGRYDIWVGSLSSTANIPATLYISEQAN